VIGNLLDGDQNPTPSPDQPPRPTPQNGPDPPF
jgi:hypothetical protein